MTIQNPWHSLPDQSPYILECDEPQIAEFNRNNANPNHHIHLDVLPEPYLGDPNAPVVILNLNPGYTAEGPNVHAQPAFAQASRDNLLHRRERFPFYLLDPGLPSPGQVWWTKSLGELIAKAGLIAKTGEEKVARCVFAAEFFPYHTIRFKHGRLRVPSREYTFSLVQRAMDREALFVVFRGKRKWFREIPALANYGRLFEVRNPRRPSISRGNLRDGFDDVVKELNNCCRRVSPD